MARVLLRLLPVLTACAMLATAAHAQINFAWNDCLGVGAHAANLLYACDGSRNGQPLRAVVSFVAPEDMTAFVGFQAVIDVNTDAVVLPDFWRLGVGECRDGNLSFPAPLTGIGTGTTGACRNPWIGANTGGGYQYNSGQITPRRARLLLAFARDSEASLTRGLHYLGGLLTLDTWKDVDTGGGACPGCPLEACLIVMELSLYQTAGTPPHDVYYLSSPAVRQYITWNSSGLGNVCFTPTRRTTWGSVKSLYR